MASLAPQNQFFHPLDCTGCTSCYCTMRRNTETTTATTTTTTTSRVAQVIGSSSAYTSKTSYRNFGCRWWLRVLLVALIIACCVSSSRHHVEARSVHHRRFYRHAVRLCSRSLSDALYMLCKDRGYNEPFPNSGEQPSGPGLVEECCYNSCTIEQMEQYCKPKKSKSS